MADEPKVEETETAQEPEEVEVQLASPYSGELPEPPKLVKIKYAGPDGMSNDDAGGALVSGETYEVPADVKDELLAHPGGWWK